MPIVTVVLRAFSLAFLINFLLFPHSLYSQNRNLLIVLFIGLPALFIFILQFLKSKKDIFDKKASFIFLTTIFIYLCAPHAARYDMDKSISYCEKLIERAQAIKAKRGTYPKRLKELWYKRPKHLLYRTNGCGYKRISGNELSLTIVHNSKSGSLKFSTTTNEWKFNVSE